MEPMLNTLSISQIDGFATYADNGFCWLTTKRIIVKYGTRPYNIGHHTDTFSLIICSKQHIVKGIL